jgi:hypothetical protein
MIAGMLQRFVRCGVLAIVLFAVAQTPIEAQSERATLGISYSFLRILNDGDLNLPAGWLVSFAGPFERSPVSLVGEVAGNYRSEFGETLHLYTVQGGLRLSGRTSRDVYPYGQFLLGLMNVGCCGDSTNHFAIEPGVGVDLRATRGVSFRFGASFPFGFDDNGTLKAFRLQAGVVLPISDR